jgi:hypothetical protein
VRRREIVEVVEVRNTTRSKSKCAGASLFPGELSRVRRLASFRFATPPRGTSTFGHHQNYLTGTSPAKRCATFLLELSITAIKAASATMHGIIALTSPTKISFDQVRRAFWRIT